MNNDLKTKSCLVYDYGTFVSVAERLAKDFGKVYYYSPWESSFPQMEYIKIGEGLEGVERIDYFWDYIDDADCIVFTDVIGADRQVLLDLLNKNVWGSRRGEKLELNRQEMKELLKDLNLPVNKYDVIKGITALREYLKKNKEIWVKIDCFRGDFESFFSYNYDYIETRIDEIEKQSGILKDLIEFICEENLPDRVELAYDGHSIDGQFPEKGMIGIEIKDEAYISVFTDYNKFPQPVIEFNEKMSPILRNYKYRNFFSPEIRIGKDKKGYMIDCCARFGSPCSEVYQLLFDNFSDIIWNGSRGICIDPVSKYKYAAEVIIHCNWAERNWLPILRPEKYKDNIKFRNVTVQNGVHYIVPQYVSCPEVGSVVAVGNSIDECIEQIEEITQQIKGFYIEFPIKTFDEAKEQIAKLKEFDFNCFD